MKHIAKLISLGILLILSIVVPHWMQGAAAGSPAGGQKWATLMNQALPNGNLPLVEQLVGTHGPIFWNDQIMDQRFGTLRTPLQLAQHELTRAEQRKDKNLINYVMVVSYLESLQGKGRPAGALPRKVSRAEQEQADIAMAMQLSREEEKGRVAAVPKRLSPAEQEALDLAFAQRLEQEEKNRAAAAPAMARRASFIANQPAALQPMVRRGSVVAGGHQAVGYAGKIYFYDKGQLYYEFTNFWNAPLNFGGRFYATSEHFYQAHKFLPDRSVAMRNAVQAVKHAPTPSASRKVAQQHQAVMRPDFHVTPGFVPFGPFFDPRLIDSLKDLIMLKGVLAKFTQHKDLSNKLIGTGMQELIENAGDEDDYWGGTSAKPGAKNFNKLGRILMYIRWAIAKGKIDEVNAEIDKRWGKYF